MAKITRYDGNFKAFGSDATGTERTVFGSTTQTDDLTANLGAEYQRGWGVLPSGQKPPKQYFNGALFGTSQAVAYLHQFGVAEWNSEQEYHDGSITNRNGQIFVCLTDDHVSATAPEADITNWRLDDGSVATISALLNRTTVGTVNVLNYHTGLEGGGGVFYWDASKPKSEHNGGTVIDPAKAFPTDWDNQTQLTTWFTAGTGTGCWVRQYDGAVSVKWFGAKGNGVTDDTAAIQAALNVAPSESSVAIAPVALLNKVPTLGEIVASMRAGATVRIACYGDSTTDGNGTTGWVANPTSGGVPVGTTDHESRAPNAWPARLKSILRDMFNNNNILVWNAGYSGQRMYNGWALSNYDIAVTNNPAYGTPDICFIGFGLNDITATNVYADHLRQTLALCIKLIETGTLPVLLTCDAIQRNDPTVRDSEEATQEIDSAKRQVAKQLNIPLFEAGAALRQWASNNSSGYTWATLQSDNLHFGNLGHSFKAGFVVSQLYPDLIVTRDGQEITAQDPRWQLNSSLTWDTYTESGPKSGRNYFATAAGGTELMRGWLWNELPNIDLHALTIAGGGTPSQPPRAYYELLDTVSNSTRTVELSGVRQVGAERTSDAPLTMQRIPVGLSRLRSLVKTGAVSGNSYSSDLLFLNTGKEHSTLHNLRLPSSVVGLSSTEGNGIIKFYVPEIYRHDYSPGDNVRIEVNVNMPVQTGILLWHSRCFFYDGTRQGGKTRMGLSLYRNSTSLYLTIASGNPDGTVEYTYSSLGTVGMSSVTANPDGTYSFLCDITWSAGIPSINVRLLDGTSLISTSLDGRDVPFSGHIGGLLQRTDSTSPPIIKFMTWGPL